MQSDPDSRPTLELVSQSSKKIVVNRPGQEVGEGVGPSERVELEDGCVVWLTARITVTCVYTYSRAVLLCA